jgi:hypothetical protein
MSVYKISFNFQLTFSNICILIKCYIICISHIFTYLFKCSSIYNAANYSQINPSSVENIVNKNAFNTFNLPSITVSRAVHLKVSVVYLPDCMAD